MEEFKAEELVHNVVFWLNGTKETTTEVVQVIRCYESEASAPYSSKAAWPWYKSEPLVSTKRKKQFSVPGKDFLLQGGISLSPFLGQTGAQAPWYYSRKILTQSYEDHKFQNTITVLYNRWRNDTKIPIGI